MHLFLSLLSNILFIFTLQNEDSAREESYEAREREREEVVGKQRERKVKG